MPKKSSPDLSLFFDILIKLEVLEIPYVIIGAFAATMYGLSRATYDIDIIVDLRENDISALSQVFPLPRYYADPHQMRGAIQQGLSFNIIDTERGEKADLFPISMDPRYTPAYKNRIRQDIEIPGLPPMSIWIARPEDVIIGKLMAWTEIGTRRHETDIHQLMVFYYLGLFPDLDPPFDEGDITRRAALLGERTLALWQIIQTAAAAEAND